MLYLIPKASVYLLKVVTGAGVTDEFYNIVSVSTLEKKNVSCNGINGVHYLGI